MWHSCHPPTTTQVFKTCLDYWNFLVPDVYTSSVGASDPTGVAGFLFGPGAPAAAPTGRKALYRPVLSKLRQLMICRMAKPEEVRVRGWWAGRGMACGSHNGHVRVQP